LIELELRGGLCQWIGAALPGHFPQQRTMRRDEARWIDLFAQVPLDLPDGFAFGDGSDVKLSRAAVRASP
jgi:hypothetical protein